MKTTLDMLARLDGLGPEEQKKWACAVEGKGWKGHWIPFQDQVNSVKSADDKDSKATTMVPPEQVPLGSGCDLVLLAIHGGGFIDGSPLMFLHYLRTAMKSLQQNHDMKVAILSVDYSKQTIGHTSKTIFLSPTFAGQQISLEKKRSIEITPF